MTTRAHFYRPVLDSAGNLRTNVSVRVLTPGTNVPIGETIYRFNDGTDSLGSQPLTFANGVIDFYLAVPKRVRLGVTAGSGSEVFFDDVDVLIPAAAGTDAAHVSFQPPAGMNSTNVQDAVDEVFILATNDATGLQAHLDDPTAAHYASAISLLPAGNIASTTVEGALYELDTEKSPTTHTHAPITVEDEGTPLTLRPAINFVGRRVTATDDATNSRTNVTVAQPFAAKTANYTLTLNDDVVFFTGTNLIATLPDASTATGVQFTIKNLDPSNLTVATTAGLIDADTTRVLLQYDALTVVSNGTIWGVI